MAILHRVSRIVCAAGGGMRLYVLEGSGRLKIDIFNLELCDAARPKVPTDLDAACAAE